MLISADLRSLDPTLLYCIGLRLDFCSYLPIGGKKLVSLGTTKFGVLGGKKYALDPTLLYCIDSDWTPLSIGGKKLVSLGTTKFGVLGGKASTHV